MKNIAPGPDACIDDCQTVVNFSDIGQDVIDALPVILHEAEPLAFPEPGSGCTAQLGNGEVIGIFYGAATRKLCFFPGVEIPHGNSLTVEAILRESGLPEAKVIYRWDRGFMEVTRKTP